MKSKKPLWLVFVLDVLLACLMLLIYAFIHHGNTYIQQQIRHALQQKDPVAAESLSEEEANSGDDSTQDVSAEEADLLPDSSETVKEDLTEDFETSLPEEEIVVDDRTEWQIKFEDHFTDEVVITETSYTSPNVSITLTPVEITEGTLVRYYIADIYIGSIEAFRTYLANNRFEVYQTQPILDMDRDSQAILAMTGDFYSYQYSGIMVRNGVWYRNSYSDSDICVLYKDGTMKTYRMGTYSQDDLPEEDIWQLWHFGPELLDENGEIPERYNTSDTIHYYNPRSSIGYYEPGHYCFVVVDGRQSDWSEGLTLAQLSQLYYDLGCTAAYNLDGGGSAVMTFQDSLVSRQSNGGDRELGDILLIAEPDTYDPSSAPEPVEMP